MSEENKNREEQPEEPIVYASPMKRIWAWVGVAYMAVIVLLMTYLFAKGTYLGGIGGLMTVPALGGVAASAICAYRTSPREKTLFHTLGLAFLLCCCAALILLGLLTGIPGLLANFGG